MPKRTVAETRFTFHPATPDRWANLETLFGKNGACGGCWCMCWRLPRKTFVAQKGNGNRIALKTIVEDNETPGILAYSGDEPAGWCAVAPREDYPALDRSRILAPVDDQSVWSVSCFFVTKAHRKKGLSVAMLRAAVEFVRERGGKILEGYPVEPKSAPMPAVFAWTGLASAFIKAGFKEVERRSPTRPIMRCEVSRRNSKKRT
jgi:GNAT superfamily N-acetyltransferase